MSTPKARRQYRHLSLFVVIALAAAVTAVPGVDAQVAEDADPLESGAQAITALGEDLADVAADNGLTAAQLKEELRADETLHVDVNGELLYVDPPPLDEPAAPDGSSSTEDDPPAVAAPPVTDPVFFLHSRPGADHTIFLDFDGNTATGTSWNAAYGVDPIVSPPYDISGDPDIWSGTELSRITATFDRVAEDFSPFDVDVTTEEPGVERLRRTGGGDTQWGTRLVVTDDTFASCGCGGHAYIGSFDDSTDEPAFVYNSSLAGVAEAASHEVGHALILAHDGLSSTTYYTGHTNGATGWAPLMGASYYQPVTQWSQGDYYDASNNTASANYGNGPDDLAVIASLTNGNGFGYRPDDHGDTTGAATALTGPSLAADGVIEKTDDLDVFSFVAGAGPATIDVDPSAGLPNLDIHAQLLDSGGAVIADSDSSGALSATFSETLTGGVYHVTVDGTGNGTPLVSPPTGYTEYGSLGQYTLSGTITDPPVNDIEGTLTEDGSGLPVPGVFVAAVGPFPTAADLAGSTFTAVDGTYSLDGLADGDYLMVFFDLTLAHTAEYFDDRPTHNGSTLLTVGPGLGSVADAGLEATPPPPGGPATLSGTVTETGSGTPIAGALVIAVGPSGLAGTVVAGPSGAYSIDLDPGDYFLEFVDLSGAHLGEWHDDHLMSELALADPVTLGLPGLTVDADLDAAP